MAAKVTLTLKKDDPRTNAILDALSKNVFIEPAQSEPEIVYLTMLNPDVTAESAMLSLPHLLNGIDESWREYVEVIGAVDDAGGQATLP